MRTNKSRSSWGDDGTRLFQRLRRTNINADLVVIAANLALKMGKKVVPDGELAKLTENLVGTIAKICRQDILARQPYVGPDAFAHKGGLHVAALKKMPMSYNHILPELVGNSARSVVSELSGRGNVLDGPENRSRSQRRHGEEGSRANKKFRKVKVLFSKMPARAWIFCFNALPRITRHRLTLLNSPFTLASHRSESYI